MADSRLTPLVERYFTDPKIHPFEEVVWEKRSAKISDEKGETIFQLDDAEIPADWSQLATDIVVSKYFRKAGVPGDEHEKSVKQVIHRIVHSIRQAGEEFGDYFTDREEAESFEMELTHLLLHQKAAFNSPVWFNCGLYQEYGIRGGSGNWYWDFGQGKLVEASNNYYRPQCSACFIQSVDDDLMKMFDLMKNEVRLFKYGSGSGSNFSNIRGKGEPISAGGKSSGLISFLKVFDAAAGSIKSGGTTRRAAKMVCLDMDHPDIMEFISWKENEEKKAAALVAEGYSSDFNGEAYGTVSAQNANNSVRVTDEFMEAVAEDKTWNTYNRVDGKIAHTYQARELWNQLCHSAWQCADPGLQYDTTINSWHTCPNAGRINASNPCSEYMFIDDSACNLASINLLKFVDENGSFDIDGYHQAIRLLFIAQEILVDFSSYPTSQIAQNTHDFRTIGLGYANLGALLMRKGIPYDSQEAYGITAGLSAILTGYGYQISTELAARKGSFSGYEKNKEAMQSIINKHVTAAKQLSTEFCPQPLREAAIEDWENTLKLGTKWGFRNAQATVIAPTGTIGLLMDCDTTSIEPDFSLVKYKKLAGGGHFKIVNQSVPTALKNLGYTDKQIKEIVTYATGTASLDKAPFINRESLMVRGITEADLNKIESKLNSAFDIVHVFNPSNLSSASLAATNTEIADFQNPNFNFLVQIGFSEKEIEEANKTICGLMTIEGAPHLKDEHLPIFDCANKCGRYGTRFIEPMGHVRIMAAAQPFISGAISKTVNLPFESTKEEISQIYFDSWKLGLKAIALYRDGSKLAQPLNSSNKKTSQKDESKTETAEEIQLNKTQEKIVIYRSDRHHLPNERKSITHKFSIGGHEGYITVGMFEDGKPGEIFITMAKQGSVISGLMDAFATSISIALQYNVPLEVLVNKFSHVRFEPSGMTNNPNIRIAKSIVDYIFRWMGMKFLDRESISDIGYNQLNINDNDLDTEQSNSAPPKSVDSVQEKTTEPERFIDAVQEKIADILNEPPPGKRLEIKDSSQTFNLRVETVIPKTNLTPAYQFDTISDAPTCPNCGGIMVRNGSCYLCHDCGETSGCS